MSHNETIMKSSFRNRIFLAIVMSFVVGMKALPYLLKSWGMNVEETDLAAYFWNFSPLLPLVLVIGTRFRLPVAMLVALGTWLASDIGIGLASGRWDYAFYAGSPITYLCMGLVVVSGFVGSSLFTSLSFFSRTGVNILSGCIGAMLFFLVSNFCVWAFAQEVLYPRTIGGLIECYTMAIPFHRNDFLSMLVYVPIFTWLLAAEAESTAVDPSWQTVSQR